MCGLPELQPKVQPSLSPAEGGGLRSTLSGTSVSAALRPGWALANPRLPKSRGSSHHPPNPHPWCLLDWWVSCTLLLYCNSPRCAVLSGCQVIRLSAVQCCWPAPTSTAHPFIHSFIPPTCIHPSTHPPALSHHITLPPIKSMNQPGGPALVALSLLPLHSTSRLVLS